MSDIQAVEVGASVLIEGLSLEEPQAQEQESLEALVEHKSPESGLLRMQAEEAIARATLPHLRQAKLKEALRDKLEELEPFFTKEEFQLCIDSEVIPVIVRLVALHDPALALSYADRLSHDDQINAYIEISRNQEAEEAKQILNMIKQRYSYVTHYLCWVCREEFRRGFSEALVTLEKLKEDFKYEKTVFDLSEFVDIVCDNGLWFEELSEIVERIHNNSLVSNRKRYDPLFTQYGLLEVLDIEARLNHPLVFQTLENLRDNATEIGLNFSEDESDEHAGYFSHEYLYACCKIIGCEARHPTLSSELEKDKDFLFKRLAFLRERFPEENDEYDLSLLCLIEDLASLNLELAKEFCQAMSESKGYYRFGATLSIMQASPASGELLNWILTHVEEESDVEYKISYLLEAFKCAHQMERDGEKEAYLEQAKQQVHLAEDEDELQDCLEIILKAEIEMDLPSAVETLQQLWEVIKKTNYHSRHLMATVLEAELTLTIKAYSV